MMADTKAVWEITVLATAARAALPRLRETLGVGRHDIAEDAALGKACGEVAVQLLHRGPGSVTDEDIEHLSRSLLETLGRTNEVSLRHMEPSSSQRSWLIDSFHRALRSLDDEGVGFWERGIDVDAKEVAILFVDVLTESLLVWGRKSEELTAVAIHLKMAKVEEQLPTMITGAEPPPVVRAWITIEETPPRVYVHNDSPSPIFDVVPTPTLIASDWNDMRQAMVGGGVLITSAASQISPEHGYCWPLEHMQSWAGKPRVRSALIVTFTDNSGRKWHLANDRLAELT